MSHPTRIPHNQIAWSVFGSFLSVCNQHFPRAVQLIHESPTLSRYVLDCLNDGARFGGLSERGRSYARSNEIYILSTDSPADNLHSILFELGNARHRERFRTIEEMLQLGAITHETQFAKFVASVEAEHLLQLQDLFSIYLKEQAREISEEEYELYGFRICEGVPAHRRLHHAQSAHCASYLSQQQMTVGESYARVARNILSDRKDKYGKRLNRLLAKSPVHREFLSYVGMKTALEVMELYKTYRGQMLDFIGDRIPEFRIR